MVFIALRNVSQLKSVNNNVTPRVGAKVPPDYLAVSNGRLEGEQRTWESYSMNPRESPSDQTEVNGPTLVWHGKVMELFERDCYVANTKYCSLNR